MHFHSCMQYSDHIHLSRILEIQVSDRKCLCHSVFHLDALRGSPVSVPNSWISIDILLSYPCAMIKFCAESGDIHLVIELEKRISGNEFRTCLSNRYQEPFPAHTPVTRSCLCFWNRGKESLSALVWSRKVSSTLLLHWATGLSC